MKIGKEVTPRTAISTSDEDTIAVRGLDLCQDLIGKRSFTEYFFLLVTGKPPSSAATAVLDATLIAIAEHGFVPSVQASRMTFSAAPEAFQGAVAAGILGCGSVILGASETAGIFFRKIKARIDSGQDLQEATTAAVAAHHASRKPLPGYGHPLHKKRDPRVQALFDVATRVGSDDTYIVIAEAVERVIPGVTGKDLRLNVSAAIPAVLLGAGFPLTALKGVPILARTAGLIAHLAEESDKPAGFALSYQASREAVYEGELPAVFGEGKDAST